MKRLAITTALLGAMALPAAAGGLLIRSNVPGCDGSSVAGFSVLGPGLTYYVAASAADRVCNGATVVPNGVDVYELDEVLAYLAALGITGLNPVFSMKSVCPNENETVQTCTVPLARVFANPNGDHW